MKFSEDQKAAIERIVERRLLADRRRRAEALKSLVDERDGLRAELAAARSDREAARQQTQLRLGGRLRRWLHIIT